MFRIIELQLKNHKIIGDLKLRFTDVENSSTQIAKKFPFHSLIIGSNGTGKSYVLRTLIDIFRYLNSLNSDENKSVKKPYFQFYIKYLLDDKIIEVFKAGSHIVSQYGDRDITQLRISDIENDKDEINLNDINFFFNNPGFSSIADNLELPSKIVASAVILNDKFPFFKSEFESFYQYLGIRNTSFSASTKSSLRKTIINLFNARKHSQTFSNNLSQVLKQIDYDKYLEIRFKTKYSSLFFSEELNVETFKSFFEEWWNTKYTKRSKDRELWGSWYYKKISEKGDERIIDLVEFLHFLKENEIFSHENKTVSFDFVNEIDQIYEEYYPLAFEYIEDLLKLDILNVDSINLRKHQIDVSFNELSSGESNLLISLIGIFSVLEDNALILIDEPEVSLHPNWQMGYIRILNDVFQHFFNSHFIIASHSHFLASSLMPNNSFIIKLERSFENNVVVPEEFDFSTYGWSTEEILYKVFQVKTTRNFYIEEDLRKLLSLISEHSKEKNTLVEIIQRLEPLTISKSDPLSKIISSANMYIKDL